MARRVETRACLPALFVVWIAVGGATPFAQVPPVRIEHRNAAGKIVDAAAGAGVTLVFRILNPATTAQSVITDVDLPEGWQVLFASSRLDLPPQGSAIETVTIAAPKNAAGGEYPVRYRARLTPSDAPVTSAVIIRIADRRQLELSWLGAPSYLPSGEPATFELLVMNHGNRKETVALDVRSGLGVPLRRSWIGGAINAGERRRVQVVRQSGQVRVGVR